MAVAYLETKEIKNTANAFRDGIGVFDQCVIDVKDTTTKVLHNWIGMGRNQFETQMTLMNRQLKDISDILYDIYDALVEAEEGYIDEDQEVAKQFIVGNI